MQHHFVSLYVQLCLKIHFYLEKRAEQKELERFEKVEEWKKEIMKKQATGEVDEEKMPAELKEPVEKNNFKVSSMYLLLGRVWLVCLEVFRGGDTHVFFTCRYYS